MQVPKEVPLELLERRVQIAGQNHVDLMYRFGLLVGEGFVTNRTQSEVFLGSHADSQARRPLFYLTTATTATVTQAMGYPIAS
jgi:hypothetical protein